MKVPPILFVPDVEAAAVARPGHWVELTAHGGELGLHVAARAADGEGRTGVLLGFVADEPLEAVAERLRAAGFPPEGEIVQIDEQDRSLYT